MIQCEYCGSRFGREECGKCPNCGAIVRNIVFWLEPHVIPGEFNPVRIAWIKPEDFEEFKELVERADTRLQV